jgi:hypothetical protein
MKKKLASRFLASVAAVASLASMSWSAHGQTANSYITPQTPLMVSSIITSSVNATILNCSTNPCINGAIVEAILLVGSSVSHTVSIYSCTSACPAATHLLGSIFVSSQTGQVGSGFSVPPINLLGPGNGSNVFGIAQALPHNNNGNTYLNIPAGTFITLSDTTPASASNPLNITIIGGAY